MANSSVIIALCFGIVIIQHGSDAQRQRGRGQYGRRVAEEAPIQDAAVEEANLQPAILLEQTTLRPKIYEIRHQISPNIGDGNFKYYSATSDGLESEQVGHFSSPLYSQVHQGSYTTKDEFGKVVQVDYVADKNGFRPLGPAGAPGLPVPPQVSVEHAKATEDILNLQKAIREQHLGYLRAGYAAHGR